MEQKIWLSGCCLLNGKCKFKVQPRKALLKVEAIISKSGVLASVHVRIHKATDIMQFLFVNSAVIIAKSHLIYWPSNDVILPAAWTG